jgi:intein-encoded DNA endonuclease-like protein
MGAVGVDIMGKREKRRKYLPLEIRIKVYDDVIELRKKGLSYTKIQKRINEKYRKQISLSRISDWINGKHKPLGKVNKFDKKPTPELAYIIGAIFGDAYKYVNVNSKGHLLRLAVSDKEFAEEFGKNLAKVLERKKSYKPFYDENLKLWMTAGCSILLYKFLNQSLKKLKPYIEYSKNCIFSFLRALFDGEGSMSKYQRKLWLYNTNKELLIYVQYLLKKYFGIDATGPHLNKRRGKVMHFTNSIVTKTTKDCYYLYVHVGSLLKFYRYIGFTIKRKQKRLTEALKQ